MMMILMMIDGDDAESDLHQHPEGEEVVQQTPPSQLMEVDIHHSPPISPKKNKHTCKRNNDISYEFESESDVIMSLSSPSLSENDTEQSDDDQQVHVDPGPCARGG